MNILITDKEVMSCLNSGFKLKIIYVPEKLNLSYYSNLVQEKYRDIVLYFPTLDLLPKEIIYMLEMALLGQKFIYIGSEYANTLLPIINHKQVGDLFWRLNETDNENYFQHFQPYDFNAIGYSKFNPIMLVGDTTNSNKPNSKLAFIGANNGCGPWFHRALIGTGEKYYITNSAGKDLSIEVNIIKPRKIVALGRNAADRLEAQNIPHAVTSHPQFMKRFQAKDIQPFIKQLS